MRFTLVEHRTVSLIVVLPSPLGGTQPESSRRLIATCTEVGAQTGARTGVATNMQIKTMAYLRLKSALSLQEIFSCWRAAFGAG